MIWGQGESEASHIGGVKTQAKLEAETQQYIESMQRHFDAIARETRAENALSFTMDRDCVNRGVCAIYFNAATRVEIVISKEALAALKTEFNPVFLMMVTVI